ncbi:uncharacterized protein LOC126858280 [Cataglyphis hispanica]|uniref:uncharacterized protein LOC126858280 n=1 Tax=Cataglyphis hispanica TaxID=1086592 RepID=UPI0021803C1D|nr:uncharacterized protein LOC126858280 [Cataglyphis hispanica]XP_050464443.1 uncharacterized protein LOC126858280 [Cataglyphis hispanica]
MCEETTVYSEMDDLEQQCEDALFEVCDARERYPLQCAKELENCIKLTNEICMAKVLVKPIKIPDLPSLTNKQSAIEKNLSEAAELLKTQEYKLLIMIDKIENLTAVLDQIKRDKLCNINKLLWQ